MAIVQCEKCGAIIDDADRTTICPHDLIMPAADLEQKKAGLELIGKDICFAHQLNGPHHRVQSCSWNGMITLQGMAGEFAPHLFVIVPPELPVLAKRPIAWMRYVSGTSEFRHASDKGDPPEDEGWIALYRRNGSWQK